MAPGVQALHGRALQPPLAQQLRRQTKADDAEQPHQQPQPAHRIDRLAEQGSRQQRHQQGLGIDQHRAQTSAGLGEAPGQQPLEQGGIHEREGEQGGDVAGINAQGAAQEPGHQEQHQGCGQQPQAGHQQGVSPLQQGLHRRHGRAPEREGQQHQQPAQQRREGGCQVGLSHGKGSGLRPAAGRMRALFLRSDQTTLIPCPGPGAARPAAPWPGSRSRVRSPEAPAPGCSRPSIR